MAWQRSRVRVPLAPPGRRRHCDHIRCVRLRCTRRRLGLDPLLPFDRSGNRFVDRGSELPSLRTPIGPSTGERHGAGDPARTFPTCHILATELHQVVVVIVVLIVASPFPQIPAGATLLSRHKVLTFCNHEYPQQPPAPTSPTGIGRILPASTSEGPSAASSLRREFCTGSGRAACSRGTQNHRDIASQTRCVRRIGLRTASPSTDHRAAGRIPPALHPRSTPLQGRFTTTQ